MDDRTQEILDSLPQRPSRSRLAQHRELIYELRRRRWPYREIAKVLEEKCRCRISISTLHDFVRLRKRADRTSAHRPAAEEAASRKQRLGKRIQRKTTGEGEREKNEADNVQRRMDALKGGPVLAKEQRVLFQYDPNKPLSVPPKDPNNGSEK